MITNMQIAKKPKWFFDIATFTTEQSGYKMNY